MLRSALIAACLVVLPFTPSSAQQPTQAQRDAIRAACRSDFMANCASVQPGGKEALECLVQNEAKLSAACKSAVNAVAAKPEAPAAAAPAPAAVPPAQTSAPAATTEAPAKAPAKKPSPVTHVTAEPPAPAAAPAPAKKPSSQQKSAVRAACRSDFMAHCSSVQPGGTQALQCLQSHAAQLSAACRSAVAAIGAGAAAPATSAAPAAPPETATAPAAAPAVLPLGPIPPMRPRRALAILALCSTEQQTLCADVPPGGGRILSCLAENAPRLSPVCYDALARASR